jgi:uncharacterized protein
VDQAVLITRLQDLDLQLMRAHRRMDEIPEKRAILQMRRRVAEFEALRDRAQQAYDAIDSGVRKSEGEAELLEQKMASEQAKMLSGDLTSPKEIANISLELDSLRRQKEKLDNDTLARMEKREQAAEQMAKVEAAITEGHRREAVLVGDFQAKGGTLTSEISALEQERASVAGEVDGDLLARYEHLRESKHGIGVGSLDEATCTACRVELPASKVAEAKAAGPIAVCPACHRLLVTAPRDDE